MHTDVLLEYASFALIAICFATLLVMWRKKLLREFPLAAALLAAQGAQSVVSVCILFFRRPLGITIPAAYHIFFWTGWFSFVSGEILRILIIYTVFRVAMLPLQGLHHIGKVIFRWVAGVSIVVSIGIAAEPHAALAGSSSAAIIFTHLTSQAQQGISVLTLCLLLFVCFATKPLGLTYRSQLFGITVGLGVLAMVDLVQAAWLATSGGHSLYSAVYLFGTLGVCTAFSVWGVYFALPEPKRRMILLPTTSPFFFWNRVSEALGADPGHVVVAGFHPNMLAAAEIEMFSAPSSPVVPELVATTERSMERSMELSLPALRSVAQH